MIFRTAILTTAAAACLAAACTPAAEAPAPAAPPAAPIAEETGPSGPAEANTTDSLASSPAADPAAAPAPASPAVPAAPAATASPTNFAVGKAAYAQACAMCHGPAGSGTQMGVALTAGLDAEAVKEKVVKGIIDAGNKMPPMGAAFSPEQLEDLSQFVAAGLPQ